MNTIRPFAAWKPSPYPPRKECKETLLLSDVGRDGRQPSLPWRLPGWCSHLTLLGPVSRVLDIYVVGCRTRDILVLKKEAPAGLLYRIWYYILGGARDAAWSCSWGLLCHSSLVFADDRQRGTGTS